MRILICDDESIIVEQLTNLIHTYNNEWIVDGVNSSLEMIELFKNKSNYYDIVFMDIVLQNENGVDVGAYLKKKLPGTTLVFITGFPGKVSELFLTVKPDGYIKKPFISNVIIAYLKKMDTEINQSEKVFDFSVRSHMHSVRAEDICFAESNRDCVCLHLPNEVFRFVGKLDDVEARLPEYFVRCHKSYLVNLGFVRDMTSKSLILFSGESINISRSRKEATVEKYYKYKGGMLK